MEINYELEPRDIIAFQKHAYKTSATNRNIRWHMYILFGAIAAYFTLFDSFYSLITRLIWFLMSIGLYLLCFWFWNSVINAYAFKKSIPEGTDNGVLGHHKIVLSENGLLETTNVNETSHSWKGVDRIEQIRDYIFIFVTPQVAHVIPKRAFTDWQSAAQFYDTAWRYKATAQGASMAAMPGPWVADGELSPVEKVIQA
jgi:YcxB-like protein